MKWFSPMGLRSMMPRTLPHSCSVLKVPVWELTVSPAFPNVLSECSSSLLMKVIKKSKGLLFCVPPDTMYFHELLISHISKFKFCLYQICDIKNQRNFEDDAQGLETQDNQEMS